VVGERRGQGDRGGYSEAYYSTKLNNYDLYDRLHQQIRIQLVELTGVMV
jgi:hypothetical protein